MTKSTSKCSSLFALLTWILGFFLLAAYPVSAARTLYYDDFQGYPAQNPAPNPFIFGPSAGRWGYVDPVPPLAAGDNFISGTASLNSQVWGTGVANGRVTNAISLAALPPGAHTFRLSFVVASPAPSATDGCIFNYEISSSGGSLTFTSGHNQDNSQTLSSLSGTARATGGNRGKTADRIFEIVFEGHDLAPSNTINISFTRVIGDPNTTYSFVLDDVRLEVEDGSGFAVEMAKGVLTLKHVRVSFTEAVGPEAATNAANYSLSGGVSVQAAKLVNPRMVELQTTTLTAGTQYNLQVSGVTNTNGVAIAATPATFTAPAPLPAIRYDAGNTITHPDGPSAPNSGQCSFWSFAGSAAAGMTTGPVADDNGTGLNAWQITDQNVANGSGGLLYTTTPTSGATAMARTNGFRMSARVRYVDNFYTVGATHFIFFADTTYRYAVLGLGINADNHLIVSHTGGTIVLTDLAPNDYHTYTVVFDPQDGGSSYYVDDQLIASHMPATAVNSGGGLIFGSSNTAGAGQANYNLVELAAVGAVQPVVTLQPQSGTYEEGKKATLTAAFSQWVNGYQWLSNGIVVPGATSTTYTTDFLTLAQNGVQYRCRALHALGCVETAPATLTVTEAVVPPQVESVRGVLTRKHVRVAFTKPVDEAGAVNIANYSFSGGLSITGARLINPVLVELTTSTQAPATQYTLQVNVIAASTPFNFNTPPAAVAAAVYDAGNSATQPGGPEAPTNSAAGFWSPGVAANPGVTAGPITDDDGTGLNAWQFTDQSTLNGTLNYSLFPNQASKDLARTNGWLLTARIRYVNSLASDLPAFFALFGDSSLSQRYGFGLGITNSSGNLLFWIPTGTTIELAGLNPFAYHTYTVASDPVGGGASYYVDDQLIADVLPQTVSADGLAFGASSSAAQGVANFNLVQLEVIGGGQPVVTLQPQSTSRIVGQTAAFTAAFSQWVNGYQWLSNGIVIPGAIAASYTTPALTTDFNGVEYRCRALHALGNVETGPAVLTVSAQPPTVSISLDGVNAKVTYVGILEYKTSMSPGTWTPVATNLSGGTYSVPVSGAPQKYFRARLP